MKSDFDQKTNGSEIRARRGFVERSRVPSLFILGTFLGFPQGLVVFGLANPTSGQSGISIGIRALLSVIVPPLLGFIEWRLIKRFGTEMTPLGVGLIVGSAVVSVVVLVVTVQLVLLFIDYGS